MLCVSDFTIMFRSLAAFVGVSVTALIRVWRVFYLQQRTQPVLLHLFVLVHAFGEFIEVAQF